MSAIIPASTLAEVSKSKPAMRRKLRVLFLMRPQVCFKTGDMEIVSRLIDGKFPDYRQLIPSTAETEITYSSILGRARKLRRYLRVNLVVELQLPRQRRTLCFSIHSIASELGENTSEATAKISADGQVTLNSRYLTEVLNIIDCR